VRPRATRSHPFDVTLCSQDDWAPLHTAAFNGHVAIAELLIKTGGKAIVHAQTKSGNTALDLARNYSRQEVVSFLERLLKIGPQSSTLAGRPPWHDTTKYDNPYTKR
jgi:ankyrin repeat protein